MSEITHCNKCVALMLDADQKAEAEEGDAMCISCRKFLAQCREEEATASFTDGMTNSQAMWFMDVLLQAKFTYSKRVPEDINEKCTLLDYSGPPGLSLLFEAGRSMKIGLLKISPQWSTIPDWSVTFSLSTPAPIILAAIKAAVDSK